MLVVPNEAKLTVLADLLVLYEVYIHLYVYDLPLTATTTLADLTGREASYPDYAPQLATEWSDPEVVSGIAVSTALPNLFVRGSGSPQQDVFGYFATSGPLGPLLWAERGAAPPYPMRAAGDQLTVIAGAGMKGQAHGGAWPG